MTPRRAPRLRLTPCAKGILLAFGVLSALACGPGAIMVSPADNGGSEKTCASAKDPLNPIVVEWGATSKVALDSVSQRGIAIVAYDRCNLRVLSGCSAKGTYLTSALKPDRHAIDMKDRNDVLALLPLAPPKVGASITSGTSLHLDYVLVGERAFVGDSVEPNGECDQATHFVKRIRLGAYTLDTRADANASATAEIGPLTAGGTHQESDQRQKSSGDPDRCEKDPTDASCSAPVMLELVPLSKTPPRPGSDTMMLRDR